MELTKSSVVKARVSHSRHVPVENKFTYRIDYLLLDETALNNNGNPYLFSYGRPNFVSLHPRDHSLRGHSTIDEVRKLIHESDIEDIDQILLLTHPRYWGYTFNPVSFWFIFNSPGKLCGVLAEVHNTFGDRHIYLCTGQDRGEIERNSWTTVSKKFHVSPFFDVVGHYSFRFLIEDSRLAVWINYDDGKGGGLKTAIVGNRLPFTDRQIVLALLRRPFGAARTTVLIHWQALRLWLKGIRYHPRPEPPVKSFTK